MLHHFARAHYLAATAISLEYCIQQYLMTMCAEICYQRSSLMTLRAEIYSLMHKTGTCMGSTARRWRARILSRGR